MKYRCVALWLIVAVFCAGTVQGQDTDYDISGYVSAQYAGVSGDGEARNDLYQSLLLDVGKPEDHAITFSAFARVIEDVDGLTDSSGFFVFEDLNDSYSTQVRSYLYHAYMDINFSSSDSKGFMDKIRIGRQFLSDIEFSHMDGVLAETSSFENAFDLKFSVFAGQPVNLYEAVTSEDWLYGAGIEFKPFKGNKTNIDYLQVQDNLTGTSIEREVVYSLKISQIFNKALSGSGMISFSENEPREARGYMRFYSIPKNLSISVTGYALLRTQDTQPVQTDTYTPVTDPWHPFVQLGATVHKGFSDTWEGEIGFYTRQLWDDEDESRYNRGFSRMYITAFAKDLIKEHLDFSLTVETWNTDDISIQTVGFSVDYQKVKKWNIGGGYMFDLYKVEEVTGEEKVNSGTLFVRHVYKPTESTRLKSQISYETNDDASYTGIKLSYTYRF